MISYHNFKPTVSKWFLLLFCFLFFSSCKKTKDDTGKGTTALVSVASFVINGNMNVIFDNTAVNTAPLGYGTGLNTDPGGYMPFGAGIHNLKISSGTGTVLDNTISLEPGKYYSFFLYDSLKDNKVKSVLLTDDLTVTAPEGRARFLQFIPGSDSLTISLKKDALTYSDNEIYFGNKAGAISEVDFSIAIPPGSYELVLERNGTSIFRQTGFMVAPGKLYTFIARGVLNGTGTLKESVQVVQHN